MGDGFGFAESELKNAISQFKSKSMIKKQIKRITHELREGYKLDQDSVRFSHLAVYKGEILAFYSFIYRAENHKDYSSWKAVTWKGGTEVSNYDYPILNDLLYP